MRHSLQSVLALAVTLSLPAALWADGCLLDKLGKYIPEKEQRAFIEWNAGQERLFVATRAEENAGPSLWIIPVPAAPEQVRAEPVEEFPHVVYTNSEAKIARENLKKLRNMAIFMDGGVGCLCVDMLGATASTTFSSIVGPDDVTVHQHVEKLGMVVEVITARSPAALNAYLTDKQIGANAADITALSPYWEKDYTFICGWIADPHKKPEARSVRIEFPSPTVFYPLRPTSVYPNPVNTSIIVRGWVQPQADVTLPGLRCEYLRGGVTTVPTEQLSDNGLVIPITKATQTSHGEKLTRVVLSNSPSDWTQDLTLEPGAPAAIHVAEIINSSAGFLLFFLISALAGAALATFLPLVMVAPERRQRSDWLLAFGVGAAICLSIIGSSVVFGLWYPARHRFQAPSPKMSPMVGLFLLLIFLPMLILLSGFSNGLWLGLLGLLLLFLSIFPFSFCVYRLADASVNQAAWLTLFAALHAAVIVLATIAIEGWLLRYV